MTTPPLDMLSTSLALENPGEFCRLMVLGSDPCTPISRLHLAKLSFACVVLGWRQALEVDADQITTDLKAKDDVNDCLILLEILFACRKLDALTRGVNYLESTWKNDKRVEDLSKRVSLIFKHTHFILHPATRTENFGVLEFSYKGFDHFKRANSTQGFYTVNLGDYIQSEAVRLALVDLGIPVSNIHYVDRDNLSSYQGEILHLVTNGVFYPKTFPLSENLHPIFIGLSLHQSNMMPDDKDEDFLEALTTLPPGALIGCRDEATAVELAQRGFLTFVSGCLSQSLQASTLPRETLRTVICGVQDQNLIRKLQSIYPDATVLTDQRYPVTEHPLSPDGMANCREAANALLTFYRQHAGRLVTSLLHCAGPCAALGIPTVIVRNDPQNIRFSAISQLLGVLSNEETLDALTTGKFHSLLNVLNNRTFQLDILESYIELNLISAKEEG